MSAALGPKSQLLEYQILIGQFNRFVETTITHQQRHQPIGSNQKQFADGEEAMSFRLTESIRRLQNSNF